MYKGVIGLHVSNKEYIQFCITLKTQGNNSVINILYKSSVYEPITDLQINIKREIRLQESGMNTQKE